jgi:hypothetical protein
MNDAKIIAEQQLNSFLTAFDDLMPVKYAKTEEEAKKIIEEVEAKGTHRFAAISNAGLKEGVRITFLPKSAFKDEGSKTRNQDMMIGNCK